MTKLKFYICNNLNIKQVSDDARQRIRSQKLRWSQEVLNITLQQIQSEGKNNWLMRLKTQKMELFTSILPLKYLKKVWKQTSICKGEVTGAYRSTTIPCLSTKNFAKFHLISSTSTPDFFAFRNLYSGAAFLPLTSICSIIHNLSIKLHILHGSSKDSQDS